MVKKSETGLTFRDRPAILEWAQPVAICAAGHLHPISDYGVPVVLVQCRRGHWTNAHGNFCSHCGVEVASR